jgi:hypothetical protein
MITGVFIVGCGGGMTDDAGTPIDIEPVRLASVEPVWGPWSNTRSFTTAWDNTTLPPPEPDPGKHGKGNGWGRGGKHK